jgi:hypothetical protein
MIRPPVQTEPRASLRSAIDAKCRDCGAADGGAHWRLHVAACTVTGCPLWSVRPLPKPAPQWLATRNPDDLPSGWARLSIDAAIRAIGQPVTGLSGAEAGSNHPEPLHGADGAANARLGGAV